MTQTTTDSYVAGYNKGRADEAANHELGGRLMFKTPDITPAQAVAIAGACIAVAAAFGFDLDDRQTSAVLQLVSVVAALLLGGDAVIRHGRATGNAKKNGE